MNEFRFIHCPECDCVGYHEPRCSGYTEICGYFVQCEDYQQNGTCEHKDAPAYERKQA